VRFRVFLPPLQDFVHAVQAAHLLTRQSTGHRAGLHSCVIVSGSHFDSSPPQVAGVLRCLVRDWMPPSQVFEHCVHAENLELRQSVGQQPWSAHISV
jgi:hypothetical protein